ncbi:subtilisin-like protease [Xylaria venustula]|nr:subtilisin-like protease [Xylaria venustula]
MSQEEIVINGVALATDSQRADASSSDHIIIRTTGEPLNRARKEELKALGVEIQEYVGTGNQQVHLCRYPKNSLVKIHVLQTAGTQANSMVEVDVLMHHDIDEVSNSLIVKISEAADVSKSAISVDDGMVRIKVKASALDAIAALDEVRVIHSVNERTCFNNVARRIWRSDDTTFNGTIYRGQDQIICVADTGFDPGSTTDVHIAFDGRVKELHAWGRARENFTDDPDGHGTHVCGSVLGRGPHISEGIVQGTAPGASLILQSLFVRFNYMNQAILGGFPKALGDLFDQAYQAGARIHTNSWGSPLPATHIQRPYDKSAESIDRYVWDHQDMTILFAAGNDGQDKDLDGTVNDRSLGAEASAKNCITVGASENNRPTLTSGKNGTSYTYGTFWPNKFTKNPLKDGHQADNPEGLAAFSSQGPTAEDRLKSDVVAPGTAILSAKSRKKKFLGSIDKTGISEDGQYMYLSGMSMATPLVAGRCAAIRECLLGNGYRDEENGVINPTASLIKALLINGAVPVSGQYVPDEFGQGPNPHSGFGRVNVANSIAMIEPSNAICGYGIGAIDEETEEPFITSIIVPSSNKSLTLKLTMVISLPPELRQNSLGVIYGLIGRYP